MGGNPGPPACCILWECRAARATALARGASPAQFTGCGHCTALQPSAQTSVLVLHSCASGVMPGTDKTDVRKAFRQLVLQYHPDHNKEPGAEKKFMAVNSAWEARAHSPIALRLRSVACCGLFAPAACQFLLRNCCLTENCRAGTL